MASSICSFEDKLAQIKLVWSETGPRALPNLRRFQKMLYEIYGPPTRHQQQRVPSAVGWLTHFGEHREWEAQKISMQEGFEWGARGKGNRPDFHKGYLTIASKPLMNALRSMRPAVEGDAPSVIRVCSQDLGMDEGSHETRHE